jgi:hypothetical protein
MQGVEVSADKWREEMKVVGCLFPQVKKSQEQKQTNN